jgi:hypothetical protein
MKSLILSAALLASGCSAGNVWYVDSRFSAEETQAIQAAADMWCDASRGQLCIDLVFNARVDVNEVSRNAIVRAGDRAAQYRFPQWIDRYPAPPAAFHHPGGTLDSSMIVVLQEHVAPQHLRVAVAHEMGHSFGIGFHLTDPSAIMFHDLTGATDKEVVTCADLIAAGVTCDQTKEPSEEVGH